MQEMTSGLKEAGERAEWILEGRLFRAEAPVGAQSLRSVHGPCSRNSGGRCARSPEGAEREPVVELLGAGHVLRRDVRFDSEGAGKPGRAESRGARCWRSLYTAGRPPWGEETAGVRDKAGRPVRRLPQLPQAGVRGGFF